MQLCLRQIFFNFQLWQWISDFFQAEDTHAKKKMRTYFLPNDLASVRFCQILAYAMLKTLVEQRESNKMKRTINFVITPEQLY
jgi:hypothetical protein